MTALRVTGLVKCYDGRAVVDGIDLSVATGELVGLLGPNGAGKTTTLESILGLVEPEAGEIEVLGLRQPRDRDKIRQRVGVALQDTHLHDKLNVRETLELFRSFYREGAMVASVIEEMDLQEAENQLVGKLSGGQRQRLGLACALIGQPDFLVMDEPSTGLDPEARHRLWDRIEQLTRDGRSVLMTTHFMEEAERLCDRVLVMDAGRVIAEGTTRALIDEHVGESVIEVEQLEGSLSLEAVRELDGARVALAVGRTLRVGCDDPAEVMGQLNHAAAAAGVKTGRIARGPATLEDVFLVLSGKSLGDAL